MRSCLRDGLPGPACRPQLLYQVLVPSVTLVQADIATMGLPSPPWACCDPRQKVTLPATAAALSSPHHSRSSWVCAVFPLFLVLHALPKPLDQSHDTPLPTGTGVVTIYGLAQRSPFSSAGFQLSCQLNIAMGIQINTSKLTSAESKTPAFTSVPQNQLPCFLSLLKVMLTPCSRLPQVSHHNLSPPLML